MAEISNSKTPGHRLLQQYSKGKRFVTDPQYRSFIISNLYREAFHKNINYRWQNGLKNALRKLWDFGMPPGTMRRKITQKVFNGVKLVYSSQHRRLFRENLQQNLRRNSF